MRFGSRSRLTWPRIVAPTNPFNAQEMFYRKVPVTALRRCKCACQRPVTVFGQQFYRVPMDGTAVYVVDKALKQESLSA